MDIISYAEEEIDSEFIRKFKKNPKLIKYISKLSDQYSKYKGTTKNKGMKSKISF